MKTHSLWKPIAGMFLGACLAMAGPTVYSTAGPADDDKVCGNDTDCQIAQTNTTILSGTVSLVASNQQRAVTVNSPVDFKEGGAAVAAAKTSVAPTNFDNRHITTTSMIGHNHTANIVFNGARGYGGTVSTNRSDNAPIVDFNNSS